MWTSVRLPRKVPKGFLSQPFPSGFCAAKALESLKLAGDVLANYSDLIEADCFKQSGRHENLTIFWVPEGEAEHQCDELTKVARKVRISISKVDIRVAHELSSRKTGKPTASLPELILSNGKPTVRSKQESRGVEDDSEKSNIFVNNDTNPLRATRLQAFKNNSGVRGEKLGTSGYIEKLVSDSLHTLQKWHLMLFSTVCDGLLQIFLPANHQYQEKGASRNLP